MTLGITKAYTPASGQVANSASYNTDIAALFNAFSGLEAQTSTLGGLTITPTSDSTTTFKLTNAAGTELVSIDTTNSRLKIKATGKLVLDGTGAETYITESAADILDIYVGGANVIKITESTADKVEIAGADLEIDATQKFYFDGGTETYIAETSADVLDIYVGGANMLKFTESTDDTMALAGVMTITPNTAVDGLTITQAQDADALFIDCDAASNWGIYCQAKYGIQVQANISGGQGLNVSRNINETGSQALIQFNEDHATSTQTVLNILNDGIGVGLNVYATYVGASHNCMTINHDGNNSNGVGLNIANGTDNNSGTNYHIIFADGDGTVVGSISSSGGTTSYTTTSDSRLKENVKDTIYGLTDLMKLQVKDFKYTRYAGEKIGLVAQDVLLAYPPAVVIPNDDTKEYYGLDYGKFTPLLIKALQELVKRVELLEAK